MEILHRFSSALQVFELFVFNPERKNLKKKNKEN
jgi:hypothetical protein